jgi:tetratricopeptide (TPR) repeat protein
MNHLNTGPMIGQEEVKDAMLLYNDGRMNEAYTKAIPFAEKGNPKAQVMIGSIFAQGALGSQNFSTARYWWKKAAQFGDAQAQANYGLTYLNGDGVNQNASKAVVWLLESAQGGNLIGMRGVGKIYMEGLEEIEPNMPLGYMWLRIASFAGDLGALNTLGKVLQDSGMAQDSLEFRSIRLASLELTLPWANLIGDHSFGRIDRGETLSYLISNFMCNVCGMQNQGINLFSQNPDRMSQGTLRDLGIELGRNLDQIAELVCQTTHAWVFYRNEFILNGPEAIPVEKEILWELLRPGDTVEISDNINSHLTIVFSINRNTNLIQFLDVWPNEFLLLPGRNLAGINAKLENFGETRQLISINKQDFLSVARGILTIGDAKFIEDIYSVFPELKTKDQVSLSVGSSLLRNKNPQVAHSGTGYIWSALKRNQSGNTSIKSIGSDRLAIGVNRCSSLEKDHIRYFDNDSTTIEIIFLSELKHILENNLKPDYKSLDPELIVELSNFFLTENMIENAFKLISDTLILFPENEMLLYEQAQIFIKEFKNGEALSNLNNVVKIIERKLYQQDILIMGIDSFLTGVSTAKKEIESFLQIVLVTRAKINFKLGHYKKALSDIKKVRERDPKNMNAIKIAIKCYNGLNELFLNLIGIKGG